MRLKKGFTLAEILIVLMIIGGLAALTLPSLMKGVNEAQFKAAYKKATNTIVNLCAMERASGGLPGNGKSDNADVLFDRFVDSLSVKSFVSETSTSPATAGVALNAGIALRDSSKFLASAPTAAARHQTWIVTDDNLAYLIIPAKDETCSTKFDIAAGQNTGTKTADNLKENACFVVWVDVNGLTSGPNTTIDAGAQSIDSADKMTTITNDQFPIYIGIDGATPGNNIFTKTGRIAADLK